MLFSHWACFGNAIFFFQSRLQNIYSLCSGESIHFVCLSNFFTASEDKLKIYDLHEFFSSFEAYILVTLGQSLNSEMFLSICSFAVASEVVEQVAVTAVFLQGSRKFYG